MCKLLFRRNKLVLLCALALRMAAQSTTGSIAGVVTDPSGAVVPNAAVVVTDLGTNIETRAATDPSGNYVVTLLPIGQYSVAVEARIQKVCCLRNKSECARPLACQCDFGIGQAADTVKVESAAPLLETDTSALGQVVDSQRIVDLPSTGASSRAWQCLPLAQYRRLPGRATKIPGVSAQTAFDLIRIISFSTV